MLRTVRAIFSLGLVTLPAIGQELAVVEAVISDIPGGIGVPEDHAFLPGQRVHISFRISGFKLVKEGNLFVEFTIEPVDCLGIAFDKPVSGRILTTASAASTRIIRSEVDVPASPWAGEASFRITLRDRVAETEAFASVPFLVRSDMPDPPESLAISGFQTFDSEYSDTPLTEAAFRPGATAWVRFFLAGFRTGENNRYKLSYGVTLKNKAGRIVFTEAQAVSESREAFYPKWYVPGLISVRLEPAIRPGDYTLTITAADDIGQQKVTGEFPIRVL